MSGLLVLAALAAMAGVWAASGSASGSTRGRGFPPELVMRIADGVVERLGLRRRLSRLGALRGTVPHRPGFLDSLAAELSGGQPPERALEAASVGVVPDPCPRARRAARLGADVPAALRVDARELGDESLVGLAACWEVAAHTGAGMAAAVTRVAHSARDSRQARAQLDSELAAVRGSARLLGLLPLFGLAVGHLMGAAPVSWLVASWQGRAVLLAGLVLQTAGIVWLRRIVAGVEACL